MASKMMSMQARPIARAQLRAQQARPAVRPACTARQQLARVGGPGLAALQRGLQTSRAAPCSRGRRAVVTEAAKKSVGDLSKADLEGKVVLVRTHPARQGARCVAGLPSYSRVRIAARCAVCYIWLHWRYKRTRRCLHLGSCACSALGLHEPCRPQCLY